MNNTANLTSSTFNRSSTYIFAPMSYDLKLALAFLSVISGLASFLGNSLLLYFTYQKRNVVHAQAFNRQLLFDRYITSLALTDVLCALISLPIFTAELFVDFIKNDIICAIVRYITMYFPIATVFNYIVICRERYLAIYKPLHLPTVTTGKKLVVASWFVAALFDLVPRPSYKLVRYDLSDNMYTHTCKYDNNTQMSRAFFLAFMLIGWVPCCIILFMTNVLTFYHMRRKSREVTPFNAVPIESVRKYKITTMFVNLIFAFLLPHMVFIVYGGVVMMLEIKLSFLSDYMVRYLITIFIYLNGAISASILFYNTRYYKRKLIALFRNVSALCI